MAIRAPPGGEDKKKGVLNPDKSDSVLAGVLLEI